MELEECERCSSFGLEKSTGLFFCKSCGTQSEKFVEEDFTQCHRLGLDETGRPTFFIAREHNAERQKQEEMLRQHSKKLKGVVPEDDDEEELKRAFVRLLAEDPDEVQEREQIRNSIADKFRSVKKVRVAEIDLYDPSETQDRLGSHIREYYMQGLQKIIQLQCEALVEKLGVSPVVCGIAGSIWFNIVGSTRVYDLDWLEEIILVADADHLEKKQKKAGKLDHQEVASEEDSGEKEIDIGSVPLTKTRRKVSKVCVKSLNQRLPLHSTLSIVFLACHVARETVLPSDIVEWATNGSLPYLAVFMEIPAKEFLGPKSNVIPVPEIEPRQLFRPDFMVNSRMVEVLAGFFGNRLGLELPPVNFPAISARLLREIGLEPESVMSYLMRLYNWYTPDGLYLTGRAAGLPTRGYVVAMLIVTLKLLYSVDGNAESSLYWPSLATILRPASSSSNSQRAKFQSVLEIIEKRLLEDALKDDFDMKKYLNYCRNVVFAGVESDPKVDPICDYLWSVFEKSLEGQSRDQARANDAEASSSSSQPNLPSTKLEEAKSKIHGRIAHELKSGGFKLIPGSCIPPPASPKSCIYSMFPAQKHQGKYKKCVPGDYFILLFAFSRASGVRCNALHKCVQEIEADILKLENAAVSGKE